MKKHSFFNLTNLLYLTLILALMSSLRHVAYSFATTNGGNYWEAYCSAIAIDLGLLAMAASINHRKKSNRKSYMLWGGVGLFSAVSTFANWTAGKVHVETLTVNTSDFGQWLIDNRPLFLSGILPMLVIYLTEVLSDSYQANAVAEQAKAKREATKAKKAPKKSDWVAAPKILHKQTA